MASMKGLYSLYLAIFVKGDDNIKNIFINKELEAKQKYNTKVNKNYFRKKKFQQWGANGRSAFPTLIDDLDIMEREDIFDIVDGDVI